LSINGIESSKELEKPGHLQPKIFMTLSIQSSALYANLCLLSYIEHDFSPLKKLRMYAPPGAIIDEVIGNYCTS